MISTISFIIIGCFYGVSDLQKLYRTEEWTGFFLYIILLSIGLVVAILLDFEVEIPNPAPAIRKLVEFIVGL